MVAARSVARAVIILETNDARFVDNLFSPFRAGNVFRPSNTRDIAAIQLVCQFCCREYVIVVTV